MVSGEALLIAIGAALAWYLGDEAWHGLKWVGVHVAHVAVAFWHAL